MEKEFRVGAEATFVGGEIPVAAAASKPLSLCAIAAATK